MEKDKLFLLLHRQLVDIQSQAERILRGETSPESIEGFAKYSEELKKFIFSKIEDPEILKISKEIPVINYRRNQIPFWQYLILPAWWISFYKGYQQKQRSIEEIRIAKGKFSSLQLLCQHA